MTANPFAAGLITASAKALAAGAAERMTQRQSNGGREALVEGFTDLAADFEVYLRHLAVAVAVGRPALLLDQMSWQKVAMKARSLPSQRMDDALLSLEEELEESLPPQSVAAPVEAIRHVRGQLDQLPDEVPSLLEADGPHAETLRRYVLSVLEGRRDDAIALVRDAARDGTPHAEIMQHVLFSAQAEIGRMWQMNEVQVGEEHLLTRVTEQAMIELRSSAPRQPADGRRALCASVGGDLHDIGVRAVADRLETTGWQSIFLGASVPSRDLAMAIRDFDADLVALGANLPLHVVPAQETIALLRSQPEIASVPILVGGRPFNVVDDLWEVIGADGHAQGPEDAVSVADQLVPRAPARSDA